MLECADLYWTGMLSGATTAFHNGDRNSSISGRFTSGRGINSSLNGQITSEDIIWMIQNGKKKRWQLDCLALPVEIWHILLKDKTFQEVLYADITIIPVKNMPANPVDNTSFVLLFNSQNATQTLSAELVKMPHYEQSIKII